MFCFVMYLFLRLPEIVLSKDVRNDKNTDFRDSGLFVMQCLELTSFFFSLSSLSLL